MDKSEAGADGDPPDSPMGAVVVGPYVVEVGSSAGTTLSVGATPDEDAAESLARALAQPEPTGEPETTAAEAVDQLVDEASAATAKVERTLALGKGLAAGRALDPAQLGLEADTLLDLLDRLDRKGRAEEALRMARTLSKLYSLLRRWLELLRALRAALRAAEKLGDLRAIGWAKHELGTLQLAGGDVAGAQRSLAEAREIRKRVGNPLDLAATERNLRVLSERVPQPPAPKPQGTGTRLPAAHLLTFVVGAVIFGAGLAGGIALGGSGGKKAARTTVTGTKTTTVTQGGATQTVTEPVTETVTDTVTTTTTVTSVEKVSPPESPVP